MPADRVNDYDVVVVGSSASGLAGALRAVERGLRVLLVEKADVCGGTAARSGGVLWGANTDAVVAAGVPDSVDVARSYVEELVGDATPIELQHRVVDSLKDLFVWLEGHQVTFTHFGKYPDYRPEVDGALPRGLMPDPVDEDFMAELPHEVAPKLDGGAGPTLVTPGKKVSGGRALIARLLAACTAAGVEVWTESPMVELVTDQDRVTGVKVARNGRTVEIAAPSGVLLASGGFDHNPDLRQRYSKGGAADWSLGAPGNTGDALQAGLAAGAATALMEEAWWAPAVLYPDGTPRFLLFDVLAPVAILTDRNGERWCDEGTPYNDLGHVWVDAAQAGRPVLPSWLVFDQRALDTYGVCGLRPDDSQDEWLDSGALWKSESLEGLAKVLDASALPESVRRWNHLAENGHDEDFGRGEPGSFAQLASAVYTRFPGVARPHPWPNPCLAPLAEGPFYAMKVVLSDLGTKGGLACDVNGRVTRRDGSVIEGLYACGGAMATPMGQAYPGPGAPITPAVVFAVSAANDMAG